VVDDNSPTHRKLRTNGRETSFHYVLHRSEKRVGPAYMPASLGAGKSYEFVSSWTAIVHNRMTFRCFSKRQDADLVLGSRYLNGIRSSIAVEPLMLSKGRQICAGRYRDASPTRPAATNVSPSHLAGNPTPAIHSNATASNRDDPQVWRQGMKIVEVHHLHRPLSRRSKMSKDIMREPSGCVRCWPRISSAAPLTPSEPRTPSRREDAGEGGAASRPGQKQQ